MIIFRYTLREIVTTLFAVTGLLLAIFISNLFVRYIGNAAGGSLPITFIGKLMLLAIPQLLGVLLPMGLFFAILLALGRMNADSEVTVLSACGFSTAALCRIVVFLGVIVAIIVGVMNMILVPNVTVERQRLVSQSGSANLVDIIAPGRFQRMGHSDRVIYVEDVDHETHQVGKLFVAEHLMQNGQSSWRVLTAKQGAVVRSHDGLGRDFVAKDGHAYLGQSGKNTFQVMKFGEYGMRLQYDPVNVSTKENTLSTAELWRNPTGSVSYRSELQWRVSISVMAIILALLAVPLSRAQPRQSKYARMLPGILVMVVYANVLIVLRDGIAEGKYPAWLGMGWLHAIMLLYAIILILWPNRKQWRWFKDNNACRS